MRSRASRRQAERRGRFGESVAAWWLRMKGWRILARRVRTPVGEIDLVAKRGSTVAFVEVKVRASMDTAAMCLDERAVQRVAAATRALAPRYAANGEDVRIDALPWAPWSRPRHLENVWHGG